MKIGIISIHSAHNFGSVLQAYALQEKIKKLGNKVQIINYRPNYIDAEYKLFSIEYYKKHKGIKNKILRLIFRILTIKSRIKKYQKFENFIKENMDTTKVFSSYKELINYNFDFDVVICGSDQIWNTKITKGIDKTYFLDFINKNILKVAYAPSIGNNKIDKKYIKEFKNKINSFDFLSVREKSTSDFLKKYTNKKINSVLDPTLLLEKKEWDRFIKKSSIKLPNKYVLVYMLEYNNKFKDIVLKISNYLNITVISINKRKYFNKEKLFSNIGPEDFLKLFKNAEMIITNSFHGTAFSIIFEKRICIIPNENSGMRLIDLSNKLGFEKNVITNEKELILPKITKEPNYKKINDNIKKQKEISEKFINDVMSSI